MVGSLAFAALAAAIVGISTYAVVKLQRAELARSKQDFTAYQLDTEKQIASANAAGETAKAEAAEATVRAKEAQLALEKYKAPRNLTLDQVGAIVEKLRPYGPIAYDIAQPKMLETGSMLTTELIHVFTTLGWELRPYHGPLPTDPMTANLIGGVPNVSREDKTTHKYRMGITSGLIGMEFTFDARFHTGWKIADDLFWLFHSYGLEAIARPTMPDPTAPADDTLHIAIGSKQ